MALELIVENLDSVPEALKGMYVASEGKFKLDVNGIEDTKGLKSALEKERTAAKEAREALKKFDGGDPDKIKAALDFFNRSEEAKMTEDERVNKRVEKREEDIARKLAEKDAEVALAREQAAKHNTRLLYGDIRAAAPTDMHPSALEDALRHAESIFELDAEGNVVPKDGKFGKDGKTPYSPKEWFEDSRATHPHRFINLNSGSSASGKPGKGSVKDLSHLKPVDRLSAAREMRK